MTSGVDGLEEPMDASEEHEVVGTTGKDESPQDVPGDPQASDGLEPEAIRTFLHSVEGRRSGFPKGLAYGS